MTNNIDRAADIINSFCCGYCEHFGQEQAHALADAGLLAPDLAPGLAPTVVEQSETIQTLSRLLAGAEEAAIERAAQIDRVRAVVDQLDKRSDAAYLAYKTNPENTRLDGQAMAYEQAVVLIQRALGGTP